MTAFNYEGGDERMINSKDTMTKGIVVPVKAGERQGSHKY
jgi:hypothetical protein